MLLAIWAGLLPWGQRTGKGRTGCWAVVGWVSSGHGLLDAPEEAHGKDHEEELQRERKKVIQSQAGYMLRCHPARLL